MSSDRLDAAREALRGVTPRLSRYIPWRPTPRQAAFLLLPVLEAFFGGAAGGAKSVALLMAALQYADVPGYAALVVRQSYQMLAQPGGLIARAHEWLGATDAVWNAEHHQWRFPSGATLTFRHLQDGGAERNFQGAEYHFVGVDEVTDFTEDQYRFLFSRLRRRRDSVVPLRMRAASNPYGPGLEWCHRRFVVERADRGIAFIPARLEDNLHLDREAYEASLKELGPVAYRQLRYGDWTIRPEGGLFQASWFDGSYLELRSVPERIRLCRYWDLAASEQVGRSDPDFTAGLLLGRDHDGVFYVIDVVRTRASPLGVQQLVKRAAERDRALALERGWPSPAVRMEQEPGSAGKALIDVYSRLVLAPFDFRGVVSTGSKEARAAPVSARAEAGHLRLCRGRWNGEFLDEVCAFPQGRHDDQVDALSGAFGVLAEAERGGRTRITQAVMGDRPRPGKWAGYDPPPPPPWRRTRGAGR